MSGASILLVYSPSRRTDKSTVAPALGPVAPVGNGVAVGAAELERGGLYADPLTRIDVRGDTLTDHVQSVTDVIRDLHITVTRTISDEGAAAVVWTIEGIWDGKLGPLNASDASVRFEGTDVFEFEHARLQRVRKS